MAAENVEPFLRLWVDRGRSSAVACSAPSQGRVSLRPRFQSGLGLATSFGSRARFTVFLLITRTSLYLLYYLCN